jgi:hypothetical protein
LFGKRGGQEGQKRVLGAHIPLEKSYDNFRLFLVLFPDCIKNNSGNEVMLLG